MPNCCETNNCKTQSDQSELNNFTLEELKRLKSLSSELAAWGWFSGICCVCVGLMMFLWSIISHGPIPFFLLDYFFNPPSIFLSPMLVLYGIICIYIHIRGRSVVTRIFIYIESILLFCFLEYGAVTPFIENFRNVSLAGICLNIILMLPVFLIALLIPAALFLIANTKFFWGHYFSKNQIMQAYACKKDSEGNLSINTGKKANVYHDFAFIFLAVLSLVLPYLLFKLGYLMIPHKERLFKVALCYHLGKGVPKDSEQAVFWYRKSAERGHAEAQFNLGQCYLFGTGVEKDPKLAVEWYRKSADQGMKEAQFKLGVCFANGWGVEKDTTQAVYWCRKAAEQGMKEAQTLLINLQFDMGGYNNSPLNP